MGRRGYAGMDRCRWVINSGLIAESFLARFDKGKMYELPGMTIAVQNDYDIRESCLLTTLTYTKENKKEVHRFRHYLYTVAELTRLLATPGLRTIALYSDTNKMPYEIGSPQLYLVCEKPHRLGNF